MSHPTIAYSVAPAMLICADTPEGFDRAAGNVEMAGARVGARIALDRAAEQIDELPPPDAVVVNVTRDGGASLDRLLDRLNLAAAGGHYPSVIDFPAQLVDVGAARAPHADMVRLCEPADAEEALAMAIMLQRTSPHLLHERNDEPPPQLSQLSEEVGRIAHALAELSRSSRSGERQLTIEAQPAWPTAELPTANAVRTIIRARRLREQTFDADLFADPAWDMLLDLMLARLEGRPVAVSSLCIAATVPPTTALRWIKRLTEEGYFVRTADPRDGRRVFIDLGDAAVEAMLRYFRSIDRVGISFG